MHDPLRAHGPINRSHRPGRAYISLRRTNHPVANLDVTRPLRSIAVSHSPCSFPAPYKEVSSHIKKHQPLTGRERKKNENRGTYFSNPLGTCVLRFWTERISSLHSGPDAHGHRGTIRWRAVRLSLLPG